MAQTGANHRLYLGYTAATPSDLKTIASLVKADGTAFGSGDTINDLVTGNELHLYDTIRDVNVGGSNNTIDTTTREDARQGFSTEVIATSAGSMTVQVKYEPRDAAGAVVDEGFQALMYAFISKSQIFAIDLDGKVDEAGSRGLAGNWSIGFSQPKPVQGLVVVDFQFALSGKPQWVYLDTTFKALVDP